jgi:acyl-CoA thioesterase-1
MRICFIGDSFVNGTGDDECLGWSGRICSDARRRGRDITLYNLGVRRDTSSDIAERWERESRVRLQQYQKAGLVFSYGLNDCVSAPDGNVRVPEAISVANTRQILGTAHAWLPTLMIGPPPTCDPQLNEQVESLSSHMTALCGSLSVPFLSPWSALKASKIWQEELSNGDGAHPNAAGYQLLADLINNWSPWRSWIDG